MNTQALIAQIAEAKAAVRRVRTPSGAKRYGQPIGTIITPDVLSSSKPTPSRHEARVAPRQDSLPESSPASRKATRRKHEPPLVQHLDWAMLKSGTAQEADALIRDLGATVKVGAEFRKDRAFMVSAAQTLNMIESEFPGFVRRHGVIVSDSNDLGGTLAYNITLPNGDPRAAVNPERHDGTRYVAGGGSGLNAVLSEHAHSTATVVTRFLQTTAQTRTQERSSDLPWSSVVDFRDLADKQTGDPAIGWYISVLTHEFGHAAIAQASGRMPYDFHDREDKDSFIQRWYAEFYADAVLDYLESVGAAKRTGKVPDASVLADVRKAQNVSQGVNAALQRIMEEDPLPERARAALTSPTSASPNEAVEALNAWEAWKAKHGAELDTLWFSEQMHLYPFPAYLDQMASAGYITDPKPERLRGVLSQYADTSWGEFEAEAFAAYMLDSKIAEPARRWGSVLHELYGWWTYDDLNPQS